MSYREKGADIPDNDMLIVEKISIHFEFPQT